MNLRALVAVLSAVLGVVSACKAQKVMLDQDGNVVPAK